MKLSDFKDFNNLKNFIFIQKNTVKICKEI